VNAAEARRLQASVVYLRPELVFERHVELASPATVTDAIAASGLRSQVEELATGDLVVGIFGELCDRDTPLHDGDRVEIYRQLTIDPKEARRIRVEVRRRRQGRAAP
jgi:putative ubiquitin-RnfH superfamily antitoxin RatB of RatAB toxin-antitoxin module